jgi:6-phosphogluconolactonase/glucosamine-6-phosphate isomerase/deaminase
LSQGKKVLWLLSGGSAIEPAVLTLKLLKDKDLSRLTISLVDERYGQPGHKDSNWQQLLKRGFEPGNARLYPVLKVSDPVQMVSDFNQFLENQLAEANFKLALLGIGTDGHTAGILPGSPAVGSTDYAIYYKAPDYQRITITLKALALMDEAVVYARGGEKAKALDDLDKTLPLFSQPAQIIKQIPAVSVYNDLKGK